MISIFATMFSFCSSGNNGFSNICSLERWSGIDGGRVGAVGDIVLSLSIVFMISIFSGMFSFCFSCNGNSNISEGWPGGDGGGVDSGCVGRGGGPEVLCWAWSSSWGVRWRFLFR